MCVCVCAQDALEKARQDIARRTQTILTLSADNESLKRANTELETAQQRLRSDLEAAQVARTALESTVKQVRQQRSPDWGADDGSISGEQRSTRTRTSAQRTRSAVHFLLTLVSMSVCDSHTTELKIWAV